MPQFSGPMCSVYTVIGDHDIPKFGGFVEELKQVYLNKLMNMAGRLKSMGTVTGAKSDFFKLDEGLKHDDNVCALYDEPDKELRLYCIRISDKIVIVGGGGPKDVKAWQHDAKLTKEVHFMMEISAIIKKKIALGNLSISNDGLRFVGNLNLP